GHAPPSRAASRGAVRRLGRGRQRAARRMSPPNELRAQNMSAAEPRFDTPSAGLDVAAIRREFPVLEQTINGRPLVYLDNAASSQRPRQVIEAISSYYERDHANVHRGVHTLSQRATDAFEGARDVVRRF